MEKCNVIGTELDVNYFDFNYAVVKKIIKSNGDYCNTTHMYNDYNSARRKFNSVIKSEKNKLYSRINIRGFFTDELVEIKALNTEEVINSYGIYDNKTKNLITQILLLKNTRK